jgi:hypothetical protein
MQASMTMQECEDIKEDSLNSSPIIEPLIQTEAKQLILKNNNSKSSLLED